MTPMDTNEEKVSRAGCHDSVLRVVPEVRSLLSTTRSTESCHPGKALAVPSVAIDVRVATTDDLPFMDALQKLHGKQVGWMPTKTLEGKIARGEVLIAIDAGGERAGYCIGQDRYFKRDDVGIIYQMNVVPGRQRGLIGATLLQAQFERSAYGCRLYCCWCAQDIAANRFWEAMGFTPLAFRTGSPSRGSKGQPRMHLFWQRRIRAGDTGDVARGGTPWWFPSQTTGGSIREDRIVLPIPPGMHWSDAKPVVLPGMESKAEGASSKRLKGRVSAAKSKPVEAETRSRVIGGGLRFASAPPVVAAAAAREKPRPEPRVKQKNDPRLIAAARELRDRWLEHANAESAAATVGKYDIARTIHPRDANDQSAKTLPVVPSKLLTAA